MTSKFGHKLLKLPIISRVVKILKAIKLPGFGTFSLYNLLETYVLGIIKGTFSSRASSIAYSFFMALFPFLLFILNLIPYIKIENFQARFLIIVNKLLPPQTKDFFYPIIEDIALNPRSSLLSFTFFLTLFLTANGVNAIFNAFCNSYYVDLNRGFYRQYLVSIGVAVVLAIVVISTISLVVYGEYLISLLEESNVIKNQYIWIKVFEFLLLLILLYTIIATLYHFGVKRNQAPSFLSIGALLTTFLFVVTTYFFGVYINNFSKYNELYGSIGALLIMMVYIWINSNLLLLGFELNTALKNLKQKSF